MVQPHGHLNSTDRLTNWGIDVDQEWHMYGKAQDTNEHLFIDCEYARILMTRLL